MLSIFDWPGFFAKMQSTFSLCLPETWGRTMLALCPKDCHWQQEARRVKVTGTAWPLMGFNKVGDTLRIANS